MPCRFSIPGRACSTRRRSRRFASSRWPRSSPGAAAYPDVPIIGFPKAPAPLRRAIAQTTGVTALGLDWTVPLARRRGCRRTARCRAISIRCGWSPAARRWPRASSDLASAWRWAAGLQSRPRHHAGNADRPCRGDDRSGARGRMAMTRSGRSDQRCAGDDARGDRACGLRGAAALFSGSIPTLLSLGQGDPCHRGDLLDGRHALSAAAVRLSRRGRPARAQSETFKVMERRLLRAHHQSGDDRHLGFGLWLAWKGFGFPAAGCTPRSAWSADVGRARLSRRRGRTFAEDRNEKPARHWRIVNEIPTLLMIVIVILVIVKPF